MLLLQKKSQIQRVYYNMILETDTKLKMLLYSRRMSVKKLSALIESNFGEWDKMDYRNLHAIVKGKNKNPTLKTMKKIWETLGVTPNEIIDF